MNSRGLTYDSTNGLYYDMETGLYYNHHKKLYFDNENGVYYHYCLNKYTNRYNLRYHSKIKRKKWMKMCELSGDNLNNIENDKLNKAFQSTSDSSQPNSDEDFTQVLFKRNEHLMSSYPPCIRAILTKSESENFKIGSLFIIPYTGGIIGDSLKRKVQTNKQNYVIDLKDEENINEIEAKIEYDLIDKCYYATGIFCNIYLKLSQIFIGILISSK
jgi:hypothetical protein